MYDRLQKLSEEWAVAMAEAVARLWRARDLPPEGALWRGWKDTKQAAGHWLYFRIPAAALTAGFAVWSALLPGRASGGERAVLAVGGTLGGALIVGAFTLALMTAIAPLRQRDEARAKLGAVEDERHIAAMQPDPIVSALTAVMHEGSEFLERFERGEAEDFMTEAHDWAWRARDEIEALTDPTEPALFAQAGRHKDPDEQIRAKIEYIRDKLQPKAREGYWTFEAAVVEPRRQALARERTKAELAASREKQHRLETRKKAAAKDAKSSANLQTELDAMQPTLREMERELERGQRERHAHEHTKLANDFEAYVAGARAKRPLEPRIGGDMFDSEGMRENDRVRRHWERLMDEWRRDTLSTYHDRFRARVLPLLEGTDSAGARHASEPASLGELEDIQAALKAIDLKRRGGPETS
jgi:hypothetical protein